MSKLKRSSVVLVVLVGLLAMSAVAMATHDESDDADTQFSFGYDELNHFLAINIEEIGEPRECDLQNGALAATYRIAEVDEDGIIQVDLDDPYTGCEVNGVVVAGPNGQINHGQFMKAAKALLGMKGGCLVRYLAKSDLGKTDATKLATPDVDPSFAILEAGDITFSTFDADCSRGKGNGPKAENENRGRSNSHGKSAIAPGRNK